MFNLLKKLVLAILASPENPIKKSLREIFYGEIVSERIVEYSLILIYLGKLGIERDSKILDIGCYYSNLSLQLASLGYKTYGLDLFPYLLKHPNFVFKQGDIRKPPFKKNSFDAVISISTIEHIGIGFYDTRKGSVDDKRAIRQIAHLLKKDGKLLITVPYSRNPRVGKTQRFYNKKTLENLLFPEFKIVEKRIFKSDKRGKWLPASEKEVGFTRIEKTTYVVIILAKKFRNTLP